jgi:hypothetical protein
METVGPWTPGIEQQAIGDEITLYNPVTHQALVLNATASDVWRLSDGEHDIEEIVRLLASSYGTEPGEIRADVLSAIEAFRAAGFLP